MIHHLVPALATRIVEVRVIGCGGNGSQMLSGLARLDHAMRALGHPGFHVCAYDPDAVSAANVGRQLFSAGDIGQNKAVLLVHRLNAWYGTRWHADPRAFRHNDKSADILISCVDTRAARAFIHHALTRPDMRKPPLYWMDLGNRAADGQVVLGQPAASKRMRADRKRLPTAPELFPEIIRGGREDNTPSCSLAEALEKQELFVNQGVVTPALQILWQLFRSGRLDWHGAFVNLKSGRTTPLPADPAVWARMRGEAAPSSTRRRTS